MIHAWAQRLVVAGTLVLQGLAGFEAHAASGALSIAEAMAAALRPSIDFPDDALLRYAERSESRNFEGIPWTLLPREAALRNHARTRFLDVVLADLREAALNEQVAVAFVRLVRARDGGSARGAALLGLESRYRDLLAERDRARVEQHSVRFLLALAMRRPGEPIGEVVIPETGAQTRGPVSLPETPGAESLRSVETVVRAHGYLIARARVLVENSAELAAARKQLEHAEALQDEEREVLGNPDAAGIGLDAAMAGVALAQLRVARAEYRAMVYREIAEALASTLP